MVKSDVAKLADAVNWLEESLKELSNESREKSSQLVSLADDLGKQILEESKKYLNKAINEMDNSYKQSIEIMKDEYSKKEKEELLLTEKLGNENYNAAVKEVIDQIKKLVSG
ncbi:MAG: hypothetical protein ACP5I6_07240 [Caldisphaera sp.]|nr:hypothetical protein [Caldisphaera sp.]PMP90193.1 MAG: hypothetical protein C0171_05720 [Caldisphaera sp.]